MRLDSASPAVPVERFGPGQIVPAVLPLNATDPLLMLWIESPAVSPAAGVGHGPTAVLEVGLQDGQAALQLLARVEAGAGSGEFVLEEPAFEAQGALLS